MRVEVLSGVERRRQWSDDEKARIVEETLVPGARVADVARRNAVSASLVFGWRRLARDGLLGRACRPHAGRDRGAAIPAVPRPKRSAGLIEIELSHGRRRLGTRACALGIVWGWGFDPDQPVHRLVVYIDLPSGQVSFHAAERGPGPDYPASWDGVPGISPSAS